MKNLREWASPEPWGFTERTFRLTEGRRGDVPHWVWAFDDNPEEIVDGKVFKSEAEAKAYMDDKMKGTYVIRTEVNE